jgi:AraC family transcriptional regulator
MHQRAIIDHASRSSFPGFLVASTMSTDISRLVEDARAALTSDLDITRRCLDQLSAVFSAKSINLDERDVPQLRLITPEGPIKGGLASWQIRKLDEHIDAYLQTTISIGTLSDMTRLSTGHFCRAFKISMGVTPHSYIRRKRIERAQSMMMASAAPLSEIASACGLADQSHLTRLFRKYVGQTPLSWRRSWKTEG